MNKKKIPSPRDILKMEIAEELGLADKVREGGWKALTSCESGRIGGIMAKRLSDKKGAPSGAPK